MGRKRYLLDSNVIIDHLGNNLEGNILEPYYDINEYKFIISIISKIEILSHSSVLNNKSIFKFMEEDTSVIELNEDIVNLTIEIRRNCKLKIPDALIAATAISNDLILLTRNLKDFKKVKSLKTINPHSI